MPNLDRGIATDRSRLEQILLWLCRRLVRRVPGYHVVPDIYGKRSHKLRDIRADPVFYRIASAIIGDRRTYLYYGRLFTLYQALDNVSRFLLPHEKALMVEVGVYRGGGTRFIAETASELLGADRSSCYCVDTFEGHSEKDLPSGREGVHTTAKFTPIAYDDVCRYLADLPFVTVIKGRIQEVTRELPNERFHLVHLDVDIYEPTIFSLDFFWNRLARGGIIVVDDYGFRTCPGVERAMAEFLAGRQSFSGFQLMTGQYVLTKM